MLTCIVYYFKLIKEGKILSKFIEFIKINLSFIKKTALIYSILCSILIITAAIFLYDSKDNEYANQYPIDNWTISVNGEQEATSISLPYKLTDNSSKVIDLYTIVPVKHYQVEAIMFTAFQKNVWVYVDNELIFQKKFEIEGYNSTESGSGKVIITLPHDSEGKELHIKLEKVVVSDNGPIPAVNIINGAITPANSIIQNKFIFASMLPVLFFGIVLIAASIAYKSLNLQLSALIHLAMFMLTESIWVLCNSKHIEVFTQNWVLVHQLEYMCLYSLPYFLWSFLKYNWNSKSKTINYMTYITGTFFVIALTLRIFFQVNFFHLLHIFHLVALLNVPAIIYVLFRMQKNKAISIKTFSIGIYALALTCIIDIIKYYFFISDKTYSNFFILGIEIMTVFLVLSFIYSTKEKMAKAFNDIANQRLSIEHKRYNIIANNTNDIFFDWNIENKTVFFTKQFEEYFETKPALTNYPYSLLDNISLVNDKEEFLSLYKRIEEGSPYEEAERCFITSQGIKKWYKVSVTTVFGEKNKPIRAIGIYRDITETKELQQSLERHKQYEKFNQELFDNVWEADISNNKIVEQNSIQLEKNAVKIETCSFDQFIELMSQKYVHPDFAKDYKKVLSRKNILDMFNKNFTSIQYDYLEANKKDNYEWIRMNVHIFRMPFDNTLRIICYFKNIDAEKKKELELREKSMRDSLTELYNKTSISNIIDEFLTSDEGRKSSHALLMLDIDNFKGINDQYGHATGDKVIIEMSNLLKHYFRETDFIGRIGGDEFVILLKNTHNKQTISHKAEQICEAVTNEMHALNCGISISIGISIFPNNGTDYNTLYINADSALYNSKKIGKNTFSYYKP